MRWRHLGYLALAGALLSPPAVTAQDSRPGIAVMPFKNGGSYGQDREDFEALEVGLQQMLLTEFAQNAQLRVVERSRIRELLEEQDLGASGRVDNATAARIGELVGARYMVMGGFTDIYGEFNMNAYFVNVETSEIISGASASVRGKRQEIYDLVVDLADKVTKELDLPALSRQAMEQRKERDVPQEAMRLYVKGLMYQDRGDSERAAELFRQAVNAYPQYTEAEAALRQVGNS